MNNETIERLRSLLEEGTITIEDIERAFPQVKEDEGEGIRKAIFKALSKKDAREVLKECGVEVSEALAWLEKQKPAEWSEEDETYFADALWCVKQAEKSCKDENDKGACWSAERWLKSLRPLPKWRPNERQLSALLAVINEPNNAGAESCHFSLEELYWDLKLLF